MFLPSTVVDAFLAAVPESHFFTVLFEKKDGSIRKMHCRRGVTAYLAGGKSTIADKENLVGVYEVGKEQYRSFDKHRVLMLRGDHMIFATKEGLMADIKTENSLIAKARQLEQQPPRPEVQKFTATVELTYDTGNLVSRPEVERKIAERFVEEIADGRAIIRVEEVQ